MGNASSLSSLVCVGRVAYHSAKIGTVESTASCGRQKTVNLTGVVVWEGGQMAPRGPGMA